MAVIIKIIERISVIVAVFRCFVFVDFMASDDVTIDAVHSPIIATETAAPAYITKMMNEIAPPSASPVSLERPTFTAYRINSTANTSASAYAIDVQMTAAFFALFRSFG